MYLFWTSRIKEQLFNMPRRSQYSSAVSGLKERVSFSIATIGVVLLRRPFISLATEEPTIHHKIELPGPRSAYHIQVKGAKKAAEATFEPC